MNRKELSPEQRGAITYGFKKQDSCRSIAKLVGCSKTAVSTTIKRYVETGSTESKNVQTGRPSIISSPNRDVLKSLVTTNRRLCTAQLINLFIAKTYLNPSAQTVRRVLSKKNLSCCVACLKPLLFKANVAKRLAWCK